MCYPAAERVAANRPDKYETIQVVALAQQLLTHGGYYDEHLEFIRLEQIQVGHPYHTDLLRSGTC